MGKIINDILDILIMNYIKTFKLYESVLGDVKISEEDGKLVFIQDDKKYFYEVMIVDAIGTKDITVDIDKIVQQPNKDFKITASAMFKTQEQEFSKERYDDILNKFKSSFTKTNKPPIEIISKPIGPPPSGKNPKTLKLIFVK